GRPPRLTCAVAAGGQAFGAAGQRPDGIFGFGQRVPGSGQPAHPGPSARGFLGAYHAAPRRAPGSPAARAGAAPRPPVRSARQTGGTDPELLWLAAAALDTSTVFGTFKIDQTSGAQIKHRTILIRWADKKPTAIRTQAAAAQQTILTA